MATPEIDGLTGLKELGRGGFGVVYRAQQPAFGREVAVKVIPGGSVDAESVQRFERECKATGAVSGHPNIVRVHDAGVTADGDPYLVMDLLPNGTLADRVRREGPLDLDTSVRLGIGLAGALETAHRAGIIHRDVKPENVLFSSFGEPQLVDFGIARMQNAYESRTGSVSATLAHAAPEVIAGSEASPRSDLYSLGSLLYFAVAGETAFGRASESSLLPLISRITSEPVPDLRLKGVPDSIADVIERAMAKIPADRFDNSAAMGEALRVAGHALDLPTIPVPIAAAAQAGDAGSPLVAASDSELTNVTNVRKRDVVDPVTLPRASGVDAGRGRAVAFTAIGLAIVLALVAVLVLRDRNKKVDTVALKDPTTTTSSTTTTEQETTTTTEEVTTSTTNTTSTTTTTTTRPPTTTTTTKPIRPPGAVVDARSSDPVAVDSINGVPQHVRVTLSWRPPPGTAGTPDEYRIRCTLMQGAAVYDGPGEPAPCKGGAEMGTVTGDVTSFRPEIERVEPGPNTWIKWQIIAVNSAGEGTPVATSVIVPNLVGLMSWEAYPFGRVVGIAVGGGERACGKPSSTICEQSRPAGIVVAGGDVVVAFEQP